MALLGTCHSKSVDSVVSVINSLIPTNDSLFKVFFTFGDNRHIFYQSGFFKSLEIALVEHGVPPPLVAQEVGDDATRSLHI